MSALDEVVRHASLATADAVPPRAFSVSAQAGVLSTRRASLPWRFANTFLRAGLCLAPHLVARAKSSSFERQRVLRLDLRFDFEDWNALELAGVLEASLLYDIQGPALERWRSLVGGALNGALATGPRWAELHTPTAALRWALDRGAARDRDPYEVQRIPPDVDGGGLSLRLGHTAEGVSALWSRWTGHGDPEAQVARVWSEGIGRAIDEASVAVGVQVQALDPATARDFKAAGRWWPSHEGGLHLRRDGVRVASVGALVERELGKSLHGDLEAPGVRLDADAQRPHLDDAMHELIAWLSASQDQGSLDLPRVLLDGRGQARTVASLREGDEVVFSWPHQVGLHGEVNAMVSALTPAQLGWLREHTGATFIPASLLVESKALERVDLTALEQGSIGPVDLGAVGEARVHAYIHRHPVASVGRLEAHVFGRVVFRRAAPELPGVTVVADLGTRDGSVGRAEAVVAAVHDSVMSRTGMLTAAALAAVVDDAGRFRMPWVAHRWSQLSALEVDLAYAPHGVGVRLRWNEEPLLFLTVAHTREGSPQTGAHALQRLRDAGGIVVAEPGARWNTLESSLPAWAPWTLTPRGGEVLARVASDAALWHMPLVPEAQLRPESLASQPHVRLSLERARELQEGLTSLGRASQWARLALLSHVLLATFEGGETWGLEHSQLLFAYDPHAADPYRRVSLLEVQAGMFAGVVPGGAAHRGLTQPVIEACPAVAHALVELGLVGAGVVRTTSLARTARAPAPVKAGRKVWLRQRVVDRRAVGALTLGEGPPGVEVWADGLRSRTLTLPPPYRGLSGRVWLQGPASEDGLAQLLCTEAGRLVESARRVVLLAVPGSDRAAALHAFLASMPITPEPATAVRRVAPVLGSDRFAATLRFALGRAAVVEVSRVSWSLLRDDEGLDLVRVGGLHPLIRAARAEGADATAIVAAASAALLELHRARRLDQAGFDEALSRVLAALE